MGGTLTDLNVVTKNILEVRNNFVIFYKPTFFHKQSVYLLKMYNTFYLVFVLQNSCVLVVEKTLKQGGAL